MKPSMKMSPSLWAVAGAALAGAVVGTAALARHVRPGASGQRRAEEGVLRACERLIKKLDAEAA